MALGPQDIVEVSVSPAVAWSQSRGGHSQDAALSAALYEALADMRLHHDLTAAIKYGMQSSATRRKVQTAHTTTPIQQTGFTTADVAGYRIATRLSCD